MQADTFPLHQAAREQQYGSSAAVACLYPRMALDTLLQGHRGCVNHLQFNDSGSLLASGSDDLHVALWDMKSSRPLLQHHTHHSANIFCVKFMPGTGDSSNPILATCAGDNEVRLHDVAAGAVVKVYTPHVGRVKKMVTEPCNPNLIISCSEDGTVRQLDTRSPRHGTQLLQLSRNGLRLEINSIASPWHKPWLLAVGASDDVLRVYDRRMSTGRNGTSRSSSRQATCKAVCHLSPAGQCHHFSSDCISGVDFANDGSQVLSNYLGDYVYLWDIPGSSSSKPSTATAVPPLGPGSSKGGGSKRSRSDLAGTPPAAAAAAAGGGGGQQVPDTGTPTAAAAVAAAGGAGGAGDAAAAGSSSPLQPPAKTRSRPGSATGTAAAAAGVVGTRMLPTTAAAAGAAAAEVDMSIEQQQQGQGQQGALEHPEGQQQGEVGAGMTNEMCESEGAAAGVTSEMCESEGGGAGQNEAPGVDALTEEAGPSRPANARVLSVDDAVERLERGDLTIAARRRGAVASAILNRSQELYEWGEVDASLRYVHVALQLRPNFGLAHYQTAVCYERLGMLAEALQAAEKALEMAWGYDLQNFVKRIRRQLAERQQDTAAAAAAARSSPTDMQEHPAAAAAAAAASGHGRRRHPSTRRRNQASVTAQTPPMEAHTGADSLPSPTTAAAAAAEDVLPNDHQHDILQAAAAADGSGPCSRQPLPPALVNRLAARGILPHSAACAAADPAAHSGAAAVAAAAVAETLAVEAAFAAVAADPAAHNDAAAAATAAAAAAAAAAAETLAVEAAFAAAVAAASGSSKSWNEDTQPAAPRAAPMYVGGDSEGVEGQDVLPSDDVDTDMGEPQPSTPHSAGGAVSGGDRHGDGSSGSMGDGFGSSGGSSGSSGGSMGDSGSISEGSDQGLVEDLSEDPMSEVSHSLEEGESQSDDSNEADEGDESQGDAGSGDDSWFDDDDEATMMGLDDDKSFFDWGGTDCPAAQAAYEAYQELQRSQLPCQQLDRDQQQQLQGERYDHQQRGSGRGSERSLDAVRFADLITHIRNQLVLLETRREEQLPRLFKRRLQQFRDRYEHTLLDARHQIAVTQFAIGMTHTREVTQEGSTERDTSDGHVEELRSLTEQQADENRQLDAQQQQRRRAHGDVGTISRDYEPLDIFLISNQLMAEIAADRAMWEQQQGPADLQEQQQEPEDTVMEEEQQHPQQQVEQQQQPEATHSQQQPGQQQEHGQQQEQQTANPLLELDLYERRMVKANKKLTRTASRHSKFVKAAEAQLQATNRSAAARPSERLSAVLRVQELALEASRIRGSSVEADLRWVQLAQRVAADRAGVAAAQQAAGAAARQQQQEQGQQQEPGHDQEQQQEQEEGADGRQAGQLGRTGRSTAAAAAHAALLPEFVEIEVMMHETLDLFGTLEENFRTSMEFLKKDAHLWQQLDNDTTAAATADAGAPAAATAAATAAAGVASPPLTAPSGHVSAEEAVLPTSSDQLQPNTTDNAADHNAADMSETSSSSSSSDSEGGSSDTGGSGGSSGLSDVLGVQVDYPQLTPRELLKEDDPVLLELGKLLAAGDPLSQAWNSSSSSKAKRWHHIPGFNDLLLHRGSSGASGQQQQQRGQLKEAPCPMDIDPALADAKRAAAAAAAEAAEAGAAAAAAAARAAAVAREAWAVGAAEEAAAAEAAAAEAEEAAEAAAKAGVAAAALAAAPGMGAVGAEDVACTAGLQSDDGQQQQQQQQGAGMMLCGGHGQPACRYRGHVSLKTVKDVSFVGPRQDMVAAGSDDGRMFIWDRNTGALVTALRGDHYVVNCIAQHPHAPALASCGIDATVKLWSPCLTHPRALSTDLLYGMAYKEVERAAVGAANMFRGFDDMYKTFSRQHAEGLVARLRAEHQQHRPQQLDGM